MAALRMDDAAPPGLKIALDRDATNMPRRWRSAGERQNDETGRCSCLSCLSRLKPGFFPSFLLFAPMSLDRKHTR